MRTHLYVVCAVANWTYECPVRQRLPLPTRSISSSCSRLPYRARVLIAHYELAPLARVEHIKSWGLADSLKWSNGKYKYFSAHSYEVAVAGMEQAKGVFAHFHRTSILSGQSGHRLYHQNQNQTKPTHSLAHTNIRTNIHAAHTRAPQNTDFSVSPLFSVVFCCCCCCWVIWFWFWRFNVCWPAPNHLNWHTGAHGGICEPVDVCVCGVLGVSTLSANPTFGMGSN